MTQVFRYRTQRCCMMTKSLDWQGHETETSAVSNLGHLFRSLPSTAINDFTVSKELPILYINQVIAVLLLLVYSNILESSFCNSYEINN